MAGETYGGNVFVVDEVTGRIYVMKGNCVRENFRGGQPPDGGRMLRRLPPSEAKKEARVHGDPRGPNSADTRCGVHETKPSHPSEVRPSGWTRRDYLLPGWHRRDKYGDPVPQADAVGRRTDPPLSPRGGARG